MAYIQSCEELERERLLEEIIVGHACPQIRLTLRQRLGIYIGQFGASPNYPSAEDVYQDAVTKVIQWLHNLRSKPDQKAIRNFENYVSRIATNVCNDYLREKSPVRHRFKNTLRDLIDTRSDFSLWQAGSQGFVAGFTLWRSQGALPVRGRVSQLEDNWETFKATAFAGIDIQRVPLEELLAAIFKWLDSPIGFDALVNIVVQILDIREQSIESLDDDEQYWAQYLIDTGYQNVSKAEMRQGVQRLWNEIKLLPDKQQEALYLSFQLDKGKDLFRLLLDYEVSTLAQIAADLKMPLYRAISLWKLMPMDNDAIAAKLNTTREQVNKWRFRALRQLEKNLTDLNRKK